MSVSEPQHSHSYFFCWGSYLTLINIMFQYWKFLAWCNTCANKQPPPSEISRSIGQCSVRCSITSDASHVRAWVHALQISKHQSTATFLTRSCKLVNRSSWKINIMIELSLKLKLSYKQIQALLALLMLLIS